MQLHTALVLFLFEKYHFKNITSLFYVAKNVNLRYYSR